MYRDKLEELAARRRSWDQHPDQAPLDVLSWPDMARAIWDVLSMAVRDFRGVIATPRSLLTFEGPMAFFSAGGQTLEELKFASLVRAYPLVYEFDVPPRPGISHNALAAVVVAAFGIRPTPMLLPVLDDRGVESVMLLHGQPSHVLVELRPVVRPGGQQPASIALGSNMTAPGANIGEVVQRVARRLDRDLGYLPVAYAGIAGRPRAGVV